MNNLKADLERLADAGVESITLLALRDPNVRHGKRSRSWAAVVATVGVIVAAVVIAAALRSPNGQQPDVRGASDLVANAAYQVPSASMSPTLEVGDVVSGATKFDAIERGDVVRLRFPKGSGLLLPPPGGDAGFKRVVGLPGETIEGHDGFVFVNGHKLSEPYATGPTSAFPHFVLAANSYFVLGDDRASSRDSRQYGPVERSDIIAIALRISAPASRAGPIAGSPRS